MYHGGLTSKQKEEVKNSYNSGKNTLLLLSSSGSEGLNLKGTKLVQILEPHFNESKIEQTIARGIRRGSHAHLPENERTVLVERYLSKFPKNIFGMETKAKTIDEYLTEMSAEKEKLKTQVKGLLQ